MTSQESSSSENSKILVLACGALANEILALKQLNGWDQIDLQCIPAKVHNYPKTIPNLVKEKIQYYKSFYQHIYVAFADCGTGGLLDKVLQEEKVERLPGAHCFAFYSGIDNFNQYMDDELGSFYLTDFFVKHFETLFVKPYKLDKHPELIQMMFGNYKRAVFLAQQESEALQIRAKQHAEYLGLEYHYIYTGYGDLAQSLHDVYSHQKVSFQN